LQISDSTSAVKARIDGAFDLAIAGHHEQFSANGDTAGIITAIDGATATKKFSAPFHNVPVCTVTPLADPIGITWWVTTTFRELSLHVSGKHSVEPRPSENVSLHFSYICMGNPN
jgi:hypothetical protein